jgi:Xaa-Pro aminopeptidase
VPTYQAFLTKLPDGGKLGFDGRTLTSAAFSRIKEALHDKNIFFAHNDDLVGMLWKDRPPMPREKAFAHPPQFAGKSSAEKLKDVRSKMKEKKITAYLITALDCVAWLLNIRGSDIKNLPVVYAFALITETDAYVFADKTKISEIELENFTLHDYDDLAEFLKNTENPYFNPDDTNVTLAGCVENSKSHKSTDDIIPLLKAVKTETELANIKNAFIKEGVAMVKMLHWLDNAGVGTTEYPITEGAIATVLQEFRKLQPHYLCDSFSSIIAYGANAALSHYNSGEIGAELHAEGFLLIDTGGQYLDGTTDTTRTICLGEISDEMKRNFTLVLKGHIALSRAVFLKGTTGTNLDILARMPLWENGLNYNHGTGHGIGYCLSVHEGPHNISRGNINSAAFVPGMLVTNEPAFYKENHYGIRTENVLAVIECAGRSDFYAFEPLTHCPIDKRAIAAELLTETETDWLNAYHKRTFETLSPHLSDEERDWLKNAAEKI